jgi:hypothetical protein
MGTYRASVSMTWEPDENGYLDWEDEYGLTLEELAEEGEKPRTEEELRTFLAGELWEYLLNNLEYDAIDVEQL